MTRHWDALSELLRDAGREDHLARRMKEERNRRGWSQGELARQLVERVGFRGLGQPAISAIETPRKGVGRRAISVDEAIALSRVFDVPLAELLLPDGALADVQSHRELGYGPTMRRDAYHQLGLYEGFVKDLAQRLGGSDSWRRYLMTEVADAKAQLAEVKNRPKERGSSRRYEDSKRLQEKISFLEDVLQRVAEADESSEEQR